jgi:hypothetical protein
MTIDPLEAIITWLEANLSGVSGRVAAKHRYGEGWTEGQTGVSVHMDGGTPDLYVNVAPVRLEVRIYATDQVDVVTIWRTLVGLSRTYERFTVAISGSKTALVHYLHPESMLSLLYDETLRMDMGVVFFETLVSEAAV